MMQRHTIYALSLMVCGALQAQPAEVYRNPTAGFEIAKPAGWHYLSGEQNAALTKNLKIRDAQLKEAVIANTAHLIAIAKYPEPYANLNPTVSVMMGPLGAYKGRKVGDLFNALLPLLSGGSPDAEVTYSPAPVVFYGLNGVYGQMRFPVLAGGRSVWQLADVWVVPRGDFFFVISSGMPWEDNPALREDLSKIVRSMKIKNQ